MGKRLSQLGDILVLLENLGDRELEIANESIKRLAKGQEEYGSFADVGDRKLISEALEEAIDLSHYLIAKLADLRGTTEADSEPVYRFKYHPLPLEPPYRVPGCPGWNAILDRLADELSQWAEVYNVKEKFGELRVHGSFPGQGDEAAQASAEMMSATVCSDCGTTLDVSTGPAETSWLRTLCGGCRRARCSK